MAKQIEFDFSLMTQRFEANLKRALRSAESFDRELADLRKTIRTLDKQLSGLDGDVDVNVSADTSAVDRAESKVKALDGSTPRVTVQTDAATLDDADAKTRALDGATPNVNIRADTKPIDAAQAKVNALDGRTANVDVRLDDSEISGMVSRLRDRTVNIRAEDRTSSSTSAIESKLDDLNKKANITLLLDVSNAIAAIESLPLIGSAQDQASAARLLEAVGAPAEAAAIVDQIYSEAYGNSREEIARMVNQFVQTGVTAPADLEDAVRSMYDVTTLGYEANEIFRAQQAIVEGGLAGSYREAANLLTAALTGAAGTKDDTLDTFYEYSRIMSEIGLEGEQFVNLLNSGAAGGAFNTDKVADAIKEANVRIEEAVAEASRGGTTAYGEALTRVGQMEAAEAYAAGDLSAEQFFTGLQDALAEKGTAFDYYEIFGSPAEDLGTSVVDALDFSAMTDEVSAALVAGIMNDTVSIAWTELTRVLENELLATFKVGGMGLTEWVNDAKGKIQTLAAEIRSGTALPEALEIALEAPGLADKIRDLEATLGAFTIEFMLGLGSLVERIGYLTGAGEGAGAGLLRAAGDMASGQLAYELKFSDDQAQVEQALKDALRRNIDPTGIADAVNTVMAELISEGDVARASEILAQMESVLGAQGPDVRVTRDNPLSEAWFEYADAGEDINEVLLDLNPLLEDANAKVEAAATNVPTLTQATNDAKKPLSDWNELLAEMAENASDVRPALETDAVTGIQKMHDALVENTDPITGYWGDIARSINEAVDAAREANALGLGGGGGGGRERASGGPVVGGQRYLVGERGPEFFVAPSNGIILPAGITSSILGGSGGSTVYASFVQNVYTGQAGAVAASDRLARSMAGYV